MARAIPALGWPEFDDALRLLRNAFLKLSGTTDRPIARRNARTNVLRALRRARTVLDTNYPAIINRSAPRTRRTPQERLRALEKAGWVQVQSGFVGYAAAGVPCRRISWKETQTSTSPATYVKRKGWVSGKTERTIAHNTFLVPSWAHVIGPDKPTELRAAKKSRLIQKATLVAEALL